MSPEQSGDQETPELQRSDVSPAAHQAEGIPAVQGERPVRQNHLQGGVKRGALSYPLSLSHQLQEFYSRVCEQEYNGNSDGF